jgi:Zn-dependent M16 (insulinase) family peptidase
MNLEFTYKDIYDVFGASQGVLTDLINNKQKGNGKFLNFLFNNRDRARAIIVESEKFRPKVEGKLKEYVDKERALLTQLPAEDIKEDEEKVKAFQEEQDKLLSDLQLEYKPELEAWEKESQKFDDKLNETVKFNPAMIKEENLPSEIDPQAMAIFYKFVITK